MRAYRISPRAEVAAPDAAHCGVVTGCASVVTGDVSPADLTNRKAKALDAANVEGPVQTQTQCRIFEQPTDEGKQFATLRALLAIKGHELHRTDRDDGQVRFYVTRWNLVRELRSLAAVRAFAEQVGATHD